MPRDPQVKSFLFRHCPRCHGDLVLDTDAESGQSKEVCYACPQCGRRVFISAMNAVKTAAVTRVA
jgi:hypothetical protein